MKKISTIIIAMFCMHGLHAQTWAEWFQQKKTQIKYLMEQIAANKVYIEYLQKGYKIARDGLTTISDIKNGEFSLHNTFFNSLKQVNPKVRYYAKVADIMALQVQITAQYKTSLHIVRTSDLLSDVERAYCQRVLSQLLDGCISNIGDLITLTTDGELQLTDDERISRIDIIYQDMQDKYSFLRQFGSDVKLLRLQHLREQNDIETSRALHGIKQINGLK